MEALVLSRKQEASRVLGKDKVFPAGDIIWSVASAEWFSMSDPVTHMHFLYCTDPEVLDLPAASPAVIDAHDAELDTQGN